MTKPVPSPIKCTCTGFGMGVTDSKNGIENLGWRIIMVYPDVYVPNTQPMVNSGTFGSFGG